MLIDWWYKGKKIRQILTHYFYSIHMLHTFITVDLILLSWHYYIHPPCWSSQRRLVLPITFKSNMSKLIKKKSTQVLCSIIILFASINWIVTPIIILFYLKQPFLTFVKYFEHFSFLAVFPTIFDNKVTWNVKNHKPTLYNYIFTK